MSKELVSSSYMETQKERHSHKPYPAKHYTLISGTAREGSIGGAIRDFMRDRGHIVDEINGDIRNTKTIELFGQRQATSLVLCQGVTHLDWIEDAPLHKIVEIIKVNLTGSILAAQTYIQASMDSPYRKSIIFIGSMAHRAVLNGSAAYCASKAGLNHFAKCLAWELAPKGYDVFCINPSNTEGTPMTADTIEGLMRYRHLSKEAATAYWGASLPREHWLQKEEIAKLVAFLLSSDGRGGYLSGAPLDLAGGQR